MIVVVIVVVVLVYCWWCIYGDGDGDRLFKGGRW